MEVDYAIIKFSDKIDLIDLEVRNVFITRSTSTSMIKYIYGSNHYSKRDALINQQRVTNKCPRCNETKIQEYIVQFK